MQYYKSIGIGIATLSKKIIVLVLVLPILFESIVNNAAYQRLRERNSRVT